MVCAEIIRPQQLLFCSYPHSCKPVIPCILAPAPATAAGRLSLSLSGRLTFCGSFLRFGLLLFALSPSGSFSAVRPPLALLRKRSSRSSHVRCPSCTGSVNTGLWITKTCDQRRTARSVGDWNSSFSNCKTICRQ